MNPKRINQRERAITVYFGSAKEKQDFAQAAAGFGLTSSVLGGMMISKAIEAGFLDQLRATLPGPSIAAGVQSAAVASGQSRHSPKRTSSTRQRRLSKARKG